MKTATGCIMVIGAHADDNELLFGGTLFKARAQGLGVIYLQSTNNMAGRHSRLRDDGSVTHALENAPDMMKLRKGECDAAAALFDTRPVHLDHPQRFWSDGRIERIELRYGERRMPGGVPPDVPSILTAHEDAACVAGLADRMIAHHPLCILTHAQSSQDLEHVATALLVMKAFRAATERGLRADLLQGPDDRAPLDDPDLAPFRGFHGSGIPAPTWDLFFGEANARWDTFIDITDFLDRKMDAIGKHRCQMPTAHLPTHPSRIRARQRGSICGCGAAEVFNWVRRWDGEDAPSHPLLTELVENTR